MILLLPQRINGLRIILHSGFYVSIIRLTTCYYGRSVKHTIIHGYLDMSAPKTSHREGEFVCIHDSRNAGWEADVKAEAMVPAL